MDEGTKENRIAEYEKLAARLLQKAREMPVGPERSAYVDGWLKMRAQVHKLSPDPCCKENRKAERKQKQRMKL